MAQIQGGPAIPVSVVTGGKIKGGKAIPVYGYTSTPTDGRRAAAGPARPVYVVSDAQMAAGTFQLEGGPAMPMYVAPSGLSVVGDAAQPVYVVGGSLGGAFTPASVAGLVAWYDFSDAATLFTDSARTTAVTADGDAIGGVTDKSGNANHLSQGTASARPLWKNTIQNNRGVARADGVNDYLRQASPTGLSNKPLSLFLVFARASSAQSKYVVALGTGGNPAVINYTSNIIEYYGSLPRASMGAPTNNVFALYEFTIDSSGNLTTYKNASQVATGSGTPAATSKIELFSDNASLFQDGDIAELIIYNSALSSTNRGLVETYLNGKWAVY